MAHAHGAAPALDAFPGLEALLDAKLAEARRTWPTIALPDEAFLIRLAEQLANEANPVSALEKLFAADFYLACGCAQGNREAVAEFENHFISDVEKYLRSQLLRSSSDEIKQALRIHLLMANGRSMPRIATYTGLHPLRGWLRMVAVRTALSVIRPDIARGRRESAEAEPELNPFAVLPEGPDPELAHLRSFYKKEFEDVLEDLLSLLSSRERALLAMYYLDGVPTEALGSAFHVSARSVRRWVERINKRILAGTANRLQERFDISSADLGALMALVQSQVAMSMSRILRRSGGPLPGQES